MLNWVGDLGNKNARRDKIFPCEGKGNDDWIHNVLKYRKETWQTIVFLA